MLESALRSAELAEADRAAPRPDHPLGQGLAACATSSTSTGCSRRARDYPLHLGLTEAGMGDKGIIASTAGLAILLNEGIGDTIRVSLTPEPGRAARARGRDRPAGPPVDGPALVPAAGQRLPRLRPDDHARSSRRWPSRSRPTSRSGCRSGARRTRAPRSCASRSWAASSTAPASRSTPTSGSACRARSRSRSRRSSSTAGSTGRCAATASSPSSSRSSRTTSRSVSRAPAATPARLSVHPSGCILPGQLNGRSVTWVTPTFLFERRSSEYDNSERRPS